MAMMYKTITLELLQDQPALYETLRAGRMLLTALDTYAVELRERHLLWIDRLNQARPGSDPRQVSSEALELAIAGLQDHLRCASSRDGTAPTAPGEMTAPLNEASPPA
jgi:hypothetical protein